MCGLDPEDMLLWDHPRLGLLEQAASAIDWGEGDLEVRGLELRRFSKVVEVVEDETREISLDAARALDPESIIGDELGVLDVESTHALRLELVAALRRRRPIEVVEESSDELRVVELLDEVARQIDRTPADLATELAGEELFWRWRIVPTLEMPADVRSVILQFCRSCMFHLEALGHEDFELFLPPDVAVLRGLFGWLQRHRRRDHFRGRRRRRR